MIQPGEEDGVLWAGVAPAALFRSDDNGRSWTLNRGLLDEPSRPKWQEGGGGLCLHSICPYPGDPERLSVAVSAAGVWHSHDGGASWRRGIEGLPRWPEDGPDEEQIQCVHNMHRAPAEPDTLYQQFHGGVFRSDDGGNLAIDRRGATVQLRVAHGHRPRRREPSFRNPARLGNGSGYRRRQGPRV